MPHIALAEDVCSKLTLSSIYFRHRCDDNNVTIAVPKSAETSIIGDLAVNGLPP